MAMKEVRYCTDGNNNQALFQKMQLQIIEVRSNKQNLIKGSINKVSISKHRDLRKLPVAEKEEAFSELQRKRMRSVVEQFARECKDSMGKTEFDGCFLGFAREGGSYMLKS
ncbi:hypothetical protein MTR_8g087205 [Medicago truncatula]|uniref:Uncharacterized protein n=1 Tax=Medicago truncatula TaxID=3880 RepID=A0A072TUZ8_MEDTR|nr:hypothetical protein MTR_8g087205 [Medicago truncatula]